MIDSHPQHTWLARAVETTTARGIGQLKVEINEEKSKSSIWQTEEVSRSLALNIAAFWAVNGSGERTTRRR